jgi:hypothetical protein
MTQFDQRYQQVENQYNADHITIRQQSLSLSEKQRKQNRTRMLDRVQRIWIEGVLEPSLQGTAQIALELQNKPSAIVTPLWHVLREFEKTEPLSSSDSSIVRVYDHASGEMLILGEPGAGKTTLLLELTGELLKRACQDETSPLPVVFSLSSWATRRQPLTEWLASELHTRYQVSPLLARSWIETDQVLPLLDGLDEVVAPHRAACVEAINTYRRIHGLLPTVVSCRQIDYLALSSRLLLRTAVIVQPLTPEQIETSLQSAGEQAETLRTALSQDADLRELATTPLMLTILLFAFRGTSVDQISEQISLNAKREQIFASYIQQMLKRRGPSKRYQPEQITHWLTSLAQQMKRQNQTLFYLEQMQLDWLSVNRMIWIYNWFAVRLPGILMGILVSLTINVFMSFSSSSFSLLPTLLLGGLLGGLLTEGSIPQRPTVSGGKARSTLGVRLLLSLLVGALIGLGSGLPIGQSVLIFALSSVLLPFLLGKNSMLEARSPTLLPVKGATWKRLIRRKEIRNGLLVGLSTALSAGLLHGLYDGLSAGLGYGLIYGLIYGLSAGLLSILLIGKSTAVQPTDLLVWSWRSLGTSLFSKSHAITTVRLMALIGLSAGLSIELSAGLGTYGLYYGLIAGLTAGLSYWLVLGLLQSVSGVTVEDQRRVVPNQGIHRSALNGLVLGLISTVIVGLVVGLIIGLASQGSQVDRLIAGLSTGLSAGLSTGLIAGLIAGLSTGLIAGLIAGLSAGLSAGLLYGGLAFLRHYVLRFLLWRTGSVPWQYVTFLDYAAERILLRKVGGGYIFLHRLVLDYFAAREIAPVFNETTERRHASLPAPVSLSNAPSEPIVPAVLPDLCTPTIALVPSTALSEPQHALPCGHELHIPSARFCSTCGAPIPFSFLP